jgi:hypothetical protein
MSIRSTIFAAVTAALGFAAGTFTSPTTSIDAALLRENENLEEQNRVLREMVRTYEAMRKAMADATDRDLTL